MKDLIYDEFQDTVSQYLVRHKSILDILSKLDESVARVNRATVKASTSCGCVKISTKHRQLPSDSETLAHFIENASNDLEGKLCENCSEVIEQELGKVFFYIAALCNTLDISMYDLLLKEHSKLKTLRYFNLT